MIEMAVSSEAPMIPRLAIFASRSSAPRSWDLLTFADAAKASGFAGVEMALADLGRD